MNGLELVVAFLAGVLMGGALDFLFSRSSSMPGSTDDAGMGDERRDDAAGYNANESYWLEIECVGYGSTYPITKAQRQFCATWIAAIAQATGLPVNRTTVHGHGDLDSVNRASCPCPKASREAFLGDVVARANAILHPPLTTVTVKAGDTLSEIAAAHRLTLAALLTFPENAKYRANPGLSARCLRGPPGVGGEGGGAGRPLAEYGRATTRGSGERGQASRPSS
jgi:LysM repeat protein